MLSQEEDSSSRLRLIMIMRSKTYKTTDSMDPILNALTFEGFDFIDDFDGFTFQLKL